MSLSNLCHREVMTIMDTNTLTEAARVMRYQHVGYLVVLQPDGEAKPPKIVGVLTDRDIVVAAVARDQDLKTLKVRDVMTTNPLLLHLESSLEGALGLMRDSGVRRAPVVGENGELMGLLALDDLLERFAENLNSLATTISNERRNEIVTRT